MFSTGLHSFSSLGETSNTISRCETLVRSHENSERSSEHETRFNLSHHQNMIKI